MAGTLHLPAKRQGKPDIIVLVQGSGPQDGEEKIGPNRPFGYLTHDLAVAGKSRKPIKYLR